MKLIAVAIIFSLLPVISFSSDRSTQVRDRYGNLVETKKDTETIPPFVIATGTSIEQSNVKADKRLSVTATEILSVQKNPIDK